MEETVRSFEDLVELLEDCVSLPLIEWADAEITGWRRLQRGERLPAGQRSRRAR